MTDFPTGIVMEAIKKRLVQTRSKDGDGYDITFQIHPDDAMSDIAKWPLGTRVALVVTRMAVDGDDVPAEATASLASPDSATPAPLKGGRRAKMAGILTRSESFDVFLHNASHWAADVSWIVDDPSGHMSDRERYIRWRVCAICRCKNFRELDHNEAAGKIWDRIESEYRASQRGDTDEARLAQRADGPS